VPGTAAIANAIFDATGVRFRNPPFTPEVVRAALNPLPPPAVPTVPIAEVVAMAADPQRQRKPRWALAGAIATGLVGLAAAALGWRTAIAPVQASTSAVYSAALVARGQQLAAVGNCVACHTAEGGLPGAGGRALATPFGTVYSSNLTPDAATGIGRWSFSAFQRAMRDGLSRDGSHLYPAFPYTAFTQTSDEDLTALYAWLMSRPAVAASVPETRLVWPFNWRPLMGLWNAVYLQPGPVAQATPHSAQWQRGAELVNGLGHCSACHTPRDALGGERAGRSYLAGALVDGWEAPPLGALSRSPLRWTEAAMLQYLRQGHHPEHGIAGGSMAEVVRGLADATESDLRAMAHYLVSLQPDRPPVPAHTLVAQAAARAAALPGPTQRLFESACGACHHDGDGPEVLGLNQPLALNTNLHSERPDNLIRTVLDGIWQPAYVEIGHMPAFGRALDDQQIAELAAYLRQRFAPDRPAWTDLAGTVARLRTAVR
jgi:nicotinate dehydrogenase subunit B